MKVLRIMLTAIFSILIAVGTVSIILGRTPIGSVAILLLYLAVVFGLNAKGGKPIKYISIFVGGILSLGLLASLYIAISPLLGETFDLMLFIAGAIIGFIGVGTIYSVLNHKHK